MILRHTIPLLLLTTLVPLPAFAQSPEPLVVYNGRSDQFVRPAAEKFTAETGIPVVLHAGSSTELLNKLRVEGSRTQADLYISTDAGTLQIGEDAGLFADLPRLIAERVPANYRGRAWVGLSARARVIVVNTDAAGLTNIDSVFDLADPALKGRLGITNASNENFVAGLGVYQALVGDTRAEAWLRGLHANAGNEVYAKHGAIVADVAAGRRALGLVNHYYYFRHQRENPDASIRLVIPDQGADDIGVAWNVAGVAVSKHTRRRAAAEAFVAFLTSKDGQRVFADANMEYPTARGVASHPALPDVAAMKVADVPMSVYDERRPAALDLIDKVGMP